MPVFRARNLAGQVEFINPDDADRWFGEPVGVHYRHPLHRTADGRWFVAPWNGEYDGPPGLPWFVEVSADDAAGWFEVNHIEIPAELVAALSAPPAAPPAAGPGRTAAGTAGTPREDRQAAGATASGSKARPPGDPATRAVAAAYALRKAGKPVSVRAACKAAVVDRKNLAAKYPEAIEIIEQLAEPDRKPPRGTSDRRTGNLDAWEDPEDDDLDDD